MDVRTMRLFFAGRSDVVVSFSCFLWDLIWFLHKEHVEMRSSTLNYIHIIIRLYTYSFISLIIIDNSYTCTTRMNYNISSYLFFRPNMATEHPSFFGKRFPDSSEMKVGLMVQPNCLVKWFVVEPGPQWDFFFSKSMEEYTIITIKCLEISCMTGSNGISFHTPKKLTWQWTKKAWKHNQAFEDAFPILIDGVSSSQPNVTLPETNIEPPKMASQQEISSSNKNNFRGALLVYPRAVFPDRAINK